MHWLFPRDAVNLTEKGGCAMPGKPWKDRGPSGTCRASAVNGAKPVRGSLRARISRDGLSL